MGITASLPNNLTNGTQADAGQVMANFNALVSALTKAIDGTDGDTVTGLINFTGGLKRDGNQVLEALSGGYRVQSGTSSASVGANSQVTITITFPVAFPNAPMAVVGLNGVSSALNGTYCSVFSISTTQLQIIVYSTAAQTVFVSYIALSS